MRFDTASLGLYAQDAPHFRQVPGSQAWYDQVIAANPSDPHHLYLGLEEMVESRDGGSTWKAIGRYWTFGMPCFLGESQVSRFGTPLGGE
ncbi:hypothetical protein [Streptomyces sp. NPDC001851]|uniref:hypothetical protein n=1 Tax=Streptomyces sp. NPDC001851 TaxID=3154529 RepID=UPI0033304855